MLRRRGDGLRAAFLVCLVVLLACEPDVGTTPLPYAPPPPPAPPAPQIAAGAATAIAGNVLGMAVTAEVRFADSVTVRYGIAGTSLDSTTPAVLVTGDTVLLPVLGLLPDTTYVLRTVAYGGGGVAEGDTLTVRTGMLPDDLPSYVASGSNPSPGYVAFSAGKYGLVIDNTGRVVWYHRFEYGAGLTFEATATGHYAARPAIPDPTGPYVWVEIDPLGTVTRTLTCARGFQPRPHDVIIESDGSYWLMCDDVRPVDLSPLGGNANAQVTATDVQHLSADGAVLFEWSPFDHFDIADLDAQTRSGATVNWTHGNALDLDTDGNLIVSFRNLSEITKIDTQNGDVLWRLGGARNQFTVVDGPTPAFARQHGLRRTAAHQLLLLDNLGDSLNSRAERYDYDPEQRLARLVASYGSTPAVSAQLGGSVQDLPGSRTLVSFGSAGRVEEYDASGGVVWRIEGAPGYIFHAQRIRSLYRPGVGLPR